MKIKEVLREQMVGRAHLTHPEDLVWLNGSAGADFAIEAIVRTVKNPKTITIKYDGYPAILWGYNTNGQFVVMDKHMFDKGVRNIDSPDSFIAYDVQRGAMRTNLHNALSSIWSSLKASTPAKTGYYWGDILFTSPLQPDSNGVYTFRANPKGIIYKINQNSDIGKMIQGKDVGIAVHQIVNADAQNLDQDGAAQSLNGTLGGLQPTGNVAILPSMMPITPQLELNETYLKFSQRELSIFAKYIDEFFANSPISLNVLRTNYFSPFINQEVIGKQNFNNLIPRFKDFVLLRAKTDKAKQILSDYLQQNEQGLRGIFTVWLALLNLKESLIPQLEKASTSSPVQGYLETGELSQEGYVANGVKFVKRVGGFAAQIHQKR